MVLLILCMFPWISLFASDLICYCLVCLCYMDYVFGLPCSSDGKIRLYPLLHPKVHYPKLHCSLVTPSLLYKEVTDKLINSEPMT